jgi:flagellar assembly protein FliH
LSRLVAGAGLHPDEVSAYPEHALPNDARGALPEFGAGRECRAIEFDSIDIIEFAPWVVLSAAQERAAALIGAAQSAAEQIHEQARREGAAAGREEAKQDAGRALIAFANAGQALIVLEEQLIARYAPRMVQLAIEIAEKMIGDAVVLDAQVAAAVLERAKNEVIHAKQIRICLHPDDRQILEELRPELFQSDNPNRRSVEIVDALDVGRGGCRLETESEIVDATIATQLDEVRRQLLDDDSAGAGNGAAEV